MKAERQTEANLCKQKTKNTVKKDHRGPNKPACKRGETQVGGQ